jgi:hypothetical protein
VRPDSAEARAAERCDSVRAVSFVFERHFSCAGGDAVVIAANAKSNRVERVDEPDF